MMCRLALFSVRTRTGTRSLLDTCRQVGGRPRFVFASSIAAFGGGAQVGDGTKLLPQVKHVVAATEGKH